MAHRLRPRHHARDRRRAAAAVAWVFATPCPATCLAQRHASCGPIYVDLGDRAIAARDRICARVHDAGLDDLARGAVPGRAGDRRADDRARLRPCWRAGHRTARIGYVPTGSAARPRCRVRLRGDLHDDQKADRDRQHVRHHPMDEHHAVPHRLRGKRTAVLVANGRCQIWWPRWRSELPGSRRIIA